MCAIYCNHALLVLHNTLLAFMLASTGSIPTQRSCRLLEFVPDTRARQFHCPVQEWVLVISFRLYVNKEYT